MKRASPVLILLFALACFAAGPSQDLQGWQAQNVKGFVLESVKTIGDKVIFSLKNVSGKVITAHSICFSRDGSHYGSCRTTDNFGTGDALVEPGGTSEEAIGADEVERYANRTVRISAVFYEDGTSEGTEFDVRRIELYHLGETFETHRIAQILSAIQTPTDAEITRLRSRVGPEPRTDSYFFTEVSRIKVPGLEIPDLSKLPKIQREQFWSSVVLIRRRMHRALDELSKLPASSPANELTREAYVSSLKDEMSDQSTRLIEICKRR